VNQEVVGADAFWLESAAYSKSRLVSLMLAQGELKLVVSPVKHSVSEGAGVQCTKRVGLA
jgi:hypothetical protein